MLKKVWNNKPKEKSDSVDETPYLVGPVDTDISEFENLPRYGDTLVTSKNIDQYVDSKRLSRLNIINEAMGLFRTDVLVRLNKYRSQYANDTDSSLAVKKLAYTHIYEQYRTAVHLLRMIPYPNTKKSSTTIDITELHEITSSDKQFTEYTKHCFEYMLKHLEIDVDNVMAETSTHIHNSMNVSQRQAVRDNRLDLFNRMQYLKREMYKTFDYLDFEGNQCGKKSYNTDNSMSVHYKNIWYFIATIYWMYVENNRIRLNKRLDVLKGMVLNFGYPRCMHNSYDDIDPNGYINSATITGGLCKFYDKYRDIIFGIDTDDNETDVS